MLSATPIIMIAVAPKDPRQAEPLPYVCMGMIAWMSIILSVLIPFDFRGDIDVMEELKALPIPANRLALGQLLTPTLIATVTQAIAMIAVIAGLGGPRVVAWCVPGLPPAGELPLLRGREPALPLVSLQDRGRAVRRHGRRTAGPVHARQDRSGWRWGWDWRR